MFPGILKQHRVVVDSCDVGGLDAAN